MYISIVLAIKNGMPHLKNSIKGLENQSYKNFELIVQDSCSTDGSIEYLNSLNLSFPIHINIEKDNNLSDGYNRGISRASGNLVTLIACDEVLDRDALKTFIEWYKGEPGAVYICGGNRLINEFGKVFQEYSPAPFTILNYLQHLTCHTMCGAFNRDILKTNLFYDASLNSIPDFEIILRLASTYGEDKIIFKPNILMSALADRSSMTYRVESYDQFIIDKTSVLNRHFSNVSEDNLSAYFYKLSLFSVYKWAANSLFRIEGGENLGMNYAFEAEKILPENVGLKLLASESKLLYWNKKTKKLERRSLLCSKIISLKKKYENLLDNNYAIVRNLFILNDGASIKSKDKLIAIRSNAKAWNYAVSIKIPTFEYDYSNYLILIELSYKLQQGLMSVSLYNSNDNCIYDETFLQVNTDFETHILECFSPEVDSILIRNGGVNQSGLLLINSLNYATIEKKFIGLET